MIIDGLIELLKTRAVNALVNGRVYKGELPRGFVLPAIVLHRYGQAQDYDFDGPIDLSEPQVQVDCLAPTPDERDTLVTAVKAELNGFTGTLPGGNEVQGCYIERDMDLPYAAGMDPKGIASRSVLGYRVVSK